MTRRPRTWILVLTLGAGLAGCSPTAPSPAPSANVAPAASPAPAPAPPPVPRAVLRGTVHDAESNPLAGVLVQAWSGPEAYAVTNANGEFSFTGLFTPSDVFHAMKEGYVGQTRSVEGGLAFVLTPRR